MRKFRRSAAVLCSAFVMGCGALIGLSEPRDRDAAAPPAGGTDAEANDTAASGADVSDAVASDLLGDKPDSATGSLDDMAADGNGADQALDGGHSAADADASSRPDVGCSPTNPPFICADARAPNGLTFFADFDENCSSIPVLRQDLPALYELSCDHFVSAPTSLHLQVPSLGNFVGYLVLEKSLPSFPQHAHVEFDLFVASVAGNSNTIAFGLGADKVGNLGSGFGFYLYPDPNTASAIDCYVQDYQPAPTPDQAQNCTGAIPLRAWSHLVFDLTRSDAGAAMHLTVAVQGAGLLFDRDLRAFVDGPNFHFDLADGTFQDAGGHWDLYFDNVSVLDQ
jgi:hypothetical protein